MHVQLPKVCRIFKSQSLTLVLKVWKEEGCWKMFFHKKKNLQNTHDFRSADHSEFSGICCNWNDLSIYHDHNTTSSASGRGKIGVLGSHQKQEQTLDSYQCGSQHSITTVLQKIKDPILTYNQGALKSNKNQTSCSFLKTVSSLRGLK